jgi:hypothetical protein
LTEDLTNGSLLKELFKPWLLPRQEQHQQNGPELTKKQLTKEKHLIKVDFQKSENLTTVVL